MLTGQTWIHLPDDLPRVAGVADFELAVMAGTLIHRRVPWVRSQRWWDLPETGTLYIGGSQQYLRAVYLISRRGFVIECFHHGEPYHLGFSADVDDLVRVLRLAFLVPEEFRRLPWLPSLRPDPDVSGAWARAYGRLLELPAPRSRPLDPRTPEQEKTDVLRMIRLEGLIPQITQLRARLDRRLLALRSDEPIQA
ncbi:hypothetical protein [Deinococcus sp.]|uniref:hypothetical protein n=1 Tax=Deinococcus sp. TaxID=47478 RepID=UPI0025B8F486|nr:hypothetical protein [Deinococcus sp.]